MRTFSITLAITVAAAVGTMCPLPAAALTVGNIEACYNCGTGSEAQNFFQGVQDGPIFEINNLTSTPLTSVHFTASGDTYNVGTIAALGSVVLIPGVSNDGGVHSGFWTVTGSILDTSDFGPSDNTTPFQLTALFSAQSAGTGIFTPATSVQASSNDGAVTLGINFLGGGPQSDGPCNDCYGPRVIATINTDTTVTPLPAALPLFATGLGAIGLLGWRRKRKNAAAIAVA
jgi:hypothetical protein